MTPLPIQEAGGMLEGDIKVLVNETQKTTLGHVRKMMKRQSKNLQSALEKNKQEILGALDQIKLIDSERWEQDKQDKLGIKERIDGIETSMLDMRTKMNLVDWLIKCTSSAIKVATFSKKASGEVREWYKIVIGWIAIVQAIFIIHSFGWHHDLYQWIEFIHIHLSKLVGGEK